MNNIMIETKEITKEYKKKKADDKVSIKVEKGSVYGFLGSNGAGKSTLMKIITGMITPTSGEVFFDGETFKRSDLLYIGSLIEDAPLYGNLTAYENLKVRTLLYGLPDERIDEVLDIVELRDTGKKKAKDFSMGMKQRLGIAIAILNKPKLLVLDEPTNGLDPQGVEDFRELIKRFKDDGVTIIISSHILSEIQKVADHIGIIENGKLLYEGKIDDKEDLETFYMDVIKGGNKNA